MSFGLCALHPIAIIFVHPPSPGPRVSALEFRMSVVPAQMSCKKQVVWHRAWLTCQSFLRSTHPTLWVCVFASHVRQMETLWEKNTPGQCFDSVWDSSSTMLDDRLKSLWLILQISRNSSRILLAVPSHTFRLRPACLKSSRCPKASAWTRVTLAQDES
jgi:hypothetical protein